MRFMQDGIEQHWCKRAFVVGVTFQRYLWIRPVMRRAICVRQVIEEDAGRLEKGN